MRKRIDRFVEDALVDFGDWFVSSDWYGKERDCVNMFAHGFLSREIQPGAAIHELTQIRIESAVPQPTGYIRPTAAKDLVIWEDGLTTTWGRDWEVKNWPRVVMEWKFKRRGHFPQEFDQHDLKWLSRFTSEYSETFGYLVRIYAGRRGRTVNWAKVARGSLNDTNRRS